MSLITRTGKGSKLTTTEMDGNLLYLQGLTKSLNSDAIANSDNEIRIKKDVQEIHEEYWENRETNINPDNIFVDSLGNTYFYWINKEINPAFNLYKWTNNEWIKIIDTPAAQAFVSNNFNNDILLLINIDGVNSIIYKIIDGVLSDPLQIDNQENSKYRSIATDTNLNLYICFSDGSKTDIFLGAYNYNTNTWTNTSIVEDTGQVIVKFKFDNLGRLYIILKTKSKDTGNYCVIKRTNINTISWIDIFAYTETEEERLTHIDIYDTAYFIFTSSTTNSLEKLNNTNKRTVISSNLTDLLITDLVVSNLGTSFILYTDMYGYYISKFQNNEWLETYVDGTTEIYRASYPAISNDNTPWVYIRGMEINLVKGYITDDYYIIDYKMCLQDSDETYKWKRIPEFIDYKTIEITDKEFVDSVTKLIELDNDINDVVIINMSPNPSSSESVFKQCLFYISKYSVVTLYGNKFLSVTISATDESASIKDEIQFILTLMYN